MSLLGIEDPSDRSRGKRDRFPSPRPAKRVGDAEAVFEGHAVLHDALHGYTKTNL